MITNIPTEYKIWVYAIDNTKKYLESDDSQILVYKFNSTMSNFKVRLINNNFEYEIAALDGLKVDGKLIIPSTHPDGKSITKIAKNGFIKCTNLKSVIIPNSIREIGNSAFAYCYNLEKVKLPDNLYILGEGVFNDCSKLKSIEIPDSIEKLDNLLFSYCESLVEINIPSSVNSISHTCFNYCNSLNNIIISSENKNYHSDGNCIISKIDNSLVYGNKYSSIPSYVTSIATNAFFCNDILEITIPKSVKRINDGAFSFCNNLTNVIIEEGIEEIGNSFNSCSNLKEINIPASVNVFGDSEKNPFYGCPNLENITISNQNTRYKIEGNCLIDLQTNTLIHAFDNVVIPFYVSKISE